MSRSYMSGWTDGYREGLRDQKQLIGHDWVEEENQSEWRAVRSRWSAIRAYRKNHREPLARAVVLEVIRRDGFVCQICHDEVPLGQIHFDHVVPFRVGGSSTADNLRVTHAKCNQMRAKSDVYAKSAS